MPINEETPIATVGLSRIYVRWVTLLAMLAGLAGFVHQGYAQATVGNPALETTTASTDTTQQPDSIPEVKPRILRLHYPSLLWGRERLDTIPYNLNRQLIWDEKDSLQGFLQELGQIGKPYERYQTALPAVLLPSPLYRHPLNNQPDVYMLNPATQVPALDTRTPFIDIDFAQSSRETQLLRVGLSQNISPYWNAYGHYRRRTAQGAYLNNTTDQWNFALNNYFRDFQRRYQGVFTLAFSELNDNLNGGTQQDGTRTETELFEKIASPTEFGNLQVRFVRRSKDVYTYHHFHLINDSTFRFTALAGGSYQFYNRRYQDQATLTELPDRPSQPYGALIFQNEAPPVDSVLQINEAAILESFRGFGGAMVRLQVGNYQLNLKGRYRQLVQGLESDWITEDLFTRQETHLKARFTGGGRALRLVAEGNLQNAFSNLFDPENRLNITGALQFGADSVTVRDSSVLDTSSRLRSQWITEPFTYTVFRTPVQVPLQVYIADLNPSIFQKYWQGQTFEGKAALKNQQVLLIKGGVEWHGSPGAYNGLAFKPNQYGLYGFFARRADPIYYDNQAQVQQALDQGGLNYLGASLRFRHRFWRIYADLSANYWIEPSDPEPAELANYLPDWFGRANIYYRGMLFNRNLRFQAGIDNWFNAGFNAFHFEPSTQVFHPGPFGITQAYNRTDIYIAGKIKRTQLFFKLIHLNEGFWSPGYYTVPFYPMLERSFSFGVRWRFTD